MPSLSSLLPLNLMQDLEKNFFDNNCKCEDCDCDSANMLNTAVRVFLTNNEEIPEMTTSSAIFAYSGFI